MAGASPVRHAWGRERGILAGVTATLHYTHGPAFAAVEITALAFIEDVEPVLRDIAERTREYGDRRILININDVVGTFTAEEHQIIGALTYRYLAHMEKVATLAPPEKITGVSAGVARAKGLELRAFPALGDAVGWLVS
ncbi:MAG: hypothetical protein JWP60_4578 [Ramlibacter sp.]|nr:hypothetical protein [Ramlibacter sp.]